MDTIAYVETYHDGTHRAAGFAYPLRYVVDSDRYLTLIEHSVIGYHSDMSEAVYENGQSINSAGIAFELFNTNQLNITTSAGEEDRTYSWRSLNKEDVDELIVALMYYRQRMAELDND